MSRRGRTSDRGQRQAAKSTDGGEPSRTGTHPDLPALLVTSGFLALLIAYLTWFLRCELTSEVSRTSTLSLLLVPDRLVADWCGGGQVPLAITDRLPAVIAATAVWAVAFCLGRLILQALGVAALVTRGERFVLAVALGLASISTAALILGLAGLLHARWLFWLAGLSVVGIFWRWGDWRNSPRISVFGRQGRAAQLARTLARPAWWWAAVPFVVVLVAGALLPPIDFDVLEYHLQVPKEWYQVGRITFLPHNVYGNMPLGAELLATTAMAGIGGPSAWWWGGLAGKLLIAGFAPLTAAALFTAGQRFFTARAGAVAALLYLSTTWITDVSINGLVDGVLAGYGFLAVYVFRLWYLCPRTRSENQLGLVALTGLLAGAAAACKYTGIAFFWIPLAAGVWLAGRPFRGRTVLAFLLASLAAGGLWYGKNAVLAGNPTYPLLYSVFGGVTRTEAKDAQWQAAHQVPRDLHGRRYSLAQLGDALLQIGGRARWNHPLLVPCCLLLVLCWRAWRQWRFWLGAAGGLLAIWWLMTHRIDRFWIPALPPLALLAGVGAVWSDAPVWRRTFTVVLALGLVYCFMVNTSTLVGNNRYLVALDALARADGATPVPPARRALERLVPPGRCALLVGEAAVFPYRVPVLYSTCFDDCLLEQLVRGRTAAERRQALAERAIAYVYVNWAEIRRYRKTYGFTDFVTPDLIDGQLVRQQRILAPVPVAGLMPQQGALYRVLPPAAGP